MRKFFLIEDEVDIDRLVEINGAAHAITNKGTYKLKEVMYSNSHVYSDANETCVVKSGSTDVYSGYYIIDKVYELTPLDHKSMLQLIPQSNLSNLEFVDLQIYMKKDEAYEFIKMHKLIVKNELVARVTNKEIVKVLKYMQFIDNDKAFKLWDDCVRKWAVTNFKGKSHEIGFYILLDEFNNDFMKKWRDEILEEPNLEDLILYIKNRGRKEEQILVDFLSKMKSYTM